MIESRQTNLRVDRKTQRKREAEKRGEKTEERGERERERERDHPSRVDAALLKGASCGWQGPVRRPLEDNCD